MALLYGTRNQVSCGEMGPVLNRFIAFIQAFAINDTIILREVLLG